MKQLIDWFTQSPLVHGIFASSSDAISVVPYDVVPAPYYIRMFRHIFASGGVHYPVGGCNAIPTQYGAIIRGFGGKILTHSPVERILTDGTDLGRKAIGVVVKGGKEILAPTVIVNVHWNDCLQNLFRGLAPSDIHANGDTILETSYSGIVFHLAFDKKVLKQKFVLKSPIVVQGESAGDLGCIMPVVSNIDESLAPRNKQLVLAGIGIPRDFSGNYDNFQERILHTIQTLSASARNVRNHLEWIDAFGPRELRSLFGEDGAVIGITPQSLLDKENRLPSCTRIEGLFHCGDDSGKGVLGVGTELAASSGLQCADLVLLGGREL